MILYTGKYAANIIKYYIYSYWFLIKAWFKILLHSDNCFMKNLLSLYTEKS